VGVAAALVVLDVVALVAVRLAPGVVALPAWFAVVLVVAAVPQPARRAVVASNALVRSRVSVRVRGIGMG
jgi:hypothetical protein